LTILESYLCQFQFLLAPRVRYDPSDVISKRKKIKSIESKEHEGLEGLQEIANREEPLEGQSYVGLISQTSTGGEELEIDVVWSSSTTSTSNKRNTSSEMAMEVDQPTSSK